MKKTLVLYLFLFTYCNYLAGLHYVVIPKVPPSSNQQSESKTECCFAIDLPDDTIFTDLSKTLPPFTEDHINATGKHCDMDTGKDKSYTVYVVQEGWHTGIIFEINDVDPQYWPEINYHQDKKYVDVGWGDEKFYQVPGFPVLIAARAVFWPTQSVMRVFAFNIPMRSAFLTGSRFLRIPLSGEQFAVLCSFISESYMTDENGNPQTSTAYGETQIFFLSTRKYHLFRTCNTWVAIAFRKAGSGNRSFLVLNKNQLLRQLSKIPAAEFIE